MDVTVSLEDFRDAFALAGAASLGKSPKAVLTCLKLTVGADRTVRLEGTDMALAVTAACVGLPTLTDEEGAVLVPRDRMMGVLRAGRGESLRLRTVGEGKLEATIGRAKTLLQTEDAADFPALPAAPETNRFVVPGRPLATALDQLLPFTDPESTRYALGGCWVEPIPAGEGGGLRLVATDGRRLAAFDVAAEPVGEPKTPSEAPTGGTVPARVMKLIAQNARSCEDATLAFEKGKVFFQTDAVTISSPLQEGRFPRYRDVFPPDAPEVKLAVAGPEPLIEALAQASVVTTEESRAVMIEATPAGMLLSAAAADVGESVVELDWAAAGDSYASFDARYLLDCLKPLAGRDDACFELYGPKQAAVCRAEGFIAVVMPLDSTSKPRRATERKTAAAAV